jgi:anti-sigma factor RsiW
MRCREVQQELSAILDGLVPPDERVAIEAHLRRCTKCQAALTRLRRLSSLLASVPVPPVPGGFTERLMARAYQHQSQRHGSRILSLGPMAFWHGMAASRRVAAAAMIVVGLAVGALMGRDMGRSVADAHSEAGRVSMADPGDLYGLDYLSEAPRGSLAGVYIALASPADGEVR